VAFTSGATNLVPGDSGSYPDVFVHDTQTGTTSRVSVDSAGVEGNGSSVFPSISADGRYVTFYSTASNLVSGDTNGETDIFLHDTVSDVTTRVSVDSSGMQGDNDSFSPVISGNGRYVAFWSRARNLVADDTNLQDDVFFHDTITGNTARVSLDAQGAESMNGSSREPAISADGRYVAFETSATNLVTNDTNGHQDIVIRSIPDVTITALFPDVLPVGDVTTVTIIGTNFLPGLTLGIGGSDKSISNVAIIDENTLTADITVDPGATTGARSVTAALAGTGPGTSRGVAGGCSGCLTFSAAVLFCPTAVLDDGIACTVDSCNESTDVVFHTPNDALCNDGNICTDDVCNGAFGCTNANNSLNCDDGNTCTINDTCSGGSCAGSNAPASTPCDDGNENTVSDSCNGSGVCVGSPI